MGSAVFNKATERLVMDKLEAGTSSWHVDLLTDNVVPSPNSVAGDFTKVIYSSYITASVTCNGVNYNADGNPHLDFAEAYFPAASVANPTEITGYMLTCGSEPDFFAVKKIEPPVSIDEDHPLRIIVDTALTGLYGDDYVEP